MLLQEGVQLRRRGGVCPERLLQQHMTPCRIVARLFEQARCGETCENRLVGRGRDGEIEKMIERSRSLDPIQFCEVLPEMRKGVGIGLVGPHIAETR